MAEVVPVIVRAGRPRSQEAFDHTLDREHGLHHAKESGKTPHASLKITPPLRGSRREGGARSRAGGGQTRRPVSECRRCLGDVVRALKRFRRLSRPQFSFRLLRLPLQCGVIAPGSAGVPPACCSLSPGSAGVPPASCCLSPGSAGVPPACCSLWWSLSFRAALQAATTSAVTATARPKESQGAAAGRFRCAQGRLLNNRNSGTADPSYSSNSTTSPILFWFSLPLRG